MKLKLKKSQLLIKLINKNNIAIQYLTKDSLFQVKKLIKLLK